MSENIFLIGNYQQGGLNYFGISSCLTAERQRKIRNRCLNPLLNNKSKTTKHLWAAFTLPTETS